MEGGGERTGLVGGWREVGRLMAPVGGWRGKDWIGWWVERERERWGGLLVGGGERPDGLREGRRNASVDSISG